MKVKNNTNKPIGIGVLNLLPGQTSTLPAPYEKHPVVKMLSIKKYDAEHTFLTLLKEDDSAKADMTGTDADSDGNGENDKKETYTLSQLKHMGKAKLEEMAKAAGIEMEDATVDKLAEALFAAQGAENGSEQ